MSEVEDDAKVNIDLPRVDGTLEQAEIQEHGPFGMIIVRADLGPVTRAGRRAVAADDLFPAGTRAWLVLPGRTVSTHVDGMRTIP